MNYVYQKHHVRIDPLTFESEVGPLVIISNYFFYIESVIQPWLLKELGYENWWQTSDRINPFQEYAFKFRSEEDATTFILKWC